LIDRITTTSPRVTILHPPRSYGVVHTLIRCGILLSRSCFIKPREVDHEQAYNRQIVSNAMGEQQPVSFAGRGPAVDESADEIVALRVAVGRLMQSRFPL